MEQHDRNQKYLEDMKEKKGFLNIQKSQMATLITVYLNPINNHWKYIYE